MIKAAWELFKGLILLGVWILLTIVMMLAAGFSFLLNIITIPIYLVCCIVAARKQAAKPRVGYLGLTIYPTRKVTPDTSSPKEFLFLLGAVLLFLFSVLSFCNDFPILGCILLISAIIIWSKYAPKKEKIAGLKAVSPSSGKKLPRSGIEFEEYCGAYLLRHGFHDVYLTPPSGDYGADIVAKDANGVTWVFQCKHYKSKVGNSCVQEVVAAKRHYGASKAAVMTNSQLTDNARELAIENDVLLFELLD